MKQLSVIVPVYNVEKCVRPCLVSIAAQSVADMEVIVVDDGSTDSSGKICDEFAAKDERFKVIHQENQGLSVARNTGLAASQGEFIGFVDGDDYIHPDMYSLLLDQIKVTEADIISCKAISVTQQDAPFAPNPPLEVKTYDREQYLYQCFGTTTQKLRYETVWNKLYKREAIGDTLFVPGMQPGQDRDFNFRVVLNCHRIAITNQVFYNWYNRNDSISYKKGLSWFHKVFHIDLKMLDHFDQLTEREQGHVLNLLMRRSIHGVDLARSASDREKKEDFKRYQRIIEGKLMSNKTVPLLRKLTLHLIAHCSFLTPLVRRIHRLFMYKNTATSTDEPRLLS